MIYIIGLNTSRLIEIVYNKPDQALKNTLFKFYSYSFILIMVMRTIIINIVINGQWVKLAHDDDGHKISFQDFKAEIHGWFYIADLLNVLVKNLTPFIIGLIFLYLFQYFGQDDEEIRKSFKIPVPRIA